MTNPFIYFLLSVSAFYMAALLILVDAFLRYRKPRSKKLVVRRLNAVSILVVLDSTAYIIGIAILVLSSNQIGNASFHFNVGLYSALFVLSWIPIFLLATMLWRSSQQVQGRSRSKNIEHFKNETYGLAFFISVTIALVAVSLSYYLYLKSSSAASIGYFLIYLLVLFDGLSLILWLSMKYGEKNQTGEVAHEVESNEMSQLTASSTVQLRASRKVSLYVFLGSFILELVLYAMSNAKIIEVGIPFDNPYFSGLGYLSGISFVLWLAFMIAR